MVPHDIVCDRLHSFRRNDQHSQTHLQRREQCLYSVATGREGSHDENCERALRVDRGKEKYALSGVAPRRDVHEDVWSRVIMKRQSKSYSRAIVCLLLQNWRERGAQDGRVNHSILFEKSLERFCQKWPRGGSESLITSLG